MMIDDFLAREINEGHITAKLEAIAAEVLVHSIVIRKRCMARLA